jgi:hypothetical protein
MAGGSGHREQSRVTDAPLTLEEAAAHFRVSRRFFQDFIASHPFYRVLGRRKLFFSDDIHRLTEALKRPCHLSSSRRVRANRQITQSAERTNESTLTELRELLTSKKRKTFSKVSFDKSNPVSFERLNLP